MPKIIEIVDDLLTTKIQYIAHQCNCISTKSAHLAQSVFHEFPYANVYFGRTTPDVLGTIKVFGNGKDQRYVINMFGQYYPGNVRYPNSSKDNYSIRENAFRSCLEKIQELPGLTGIAFPYKIGCGAAGGDWIKYSEMLEEFAKELFPFVDVYVVKLSGEK